MKTIRYMASGLLLFMVVFSLIPVASADGNSPVTVESENLIVYPVDQNTVGVVQIMKIKNQTDQSINQLKLYLPKGYQNLQIRKGLDKKKVNTTDKGLVDPTGMKANEKKQVMLTYQMPMKKGTASWTIEQANLTKELYIVVQKGVFSLRAADLATQSNVFKMNGQQYRRFTRLDLHAGIPWRVTFKLLGGGQFSKGQNQAGAMTNSGNGGTNSNTSGVNTKVTADGKPILSHQHGGDFTIAIVTFVLIVVALTFALVGLRRDAIRISRIRKKPKRSWLHAEKNHLLEEIGQLEDDRESGLIGENTYLSTRKRLRDQLVRITSEVREG